MTLCPITDENTDLLDRQEYVAKMLNVAEVLSANKKNACYAINGAWGVGKTFVLNMFEAQASIIEKECEALPRYLIFRYNCWEYDFYDEPLIAIVASILDQIDEKGTGLPAKTKDKIVGVLKVLATELLNKALQLAESETSLPLKKAAEIITDSFSQSSESFSEANKYDKYFDFKKILNQLQKTIAALAKEQTLIFIVDELDRCLPNYTIKVLERLHHLFNGITNVQVILAIDKSQLEYVVKQIYGHDTNVNKYLSKFISFELKLTEGEFSDYAKFYNKFSVYTNRFSFSTTATRDDVAEFLKIVFVGIDMRNRIDILNKCSLLHGILYNDDEQIDSAYMCVEILLTIVKYSGIDIHLSAGLFSTSKVFRMPSDGDPIKGLQNISDKYNNPNSNIKYYGIDGKSKYVRTSDIWGVLLAAFRCIIGFNNDYFLHGNITEESLKSFSKNFWNLLQIIY